MGSRKTTVIERFWMRVDVTDTCWNWTGAIRRGGYGRFAPGGEVNECPAHRFAYELLVGTVPDGLQLDHLCRNRVCVNPAHLEPVTGRENVMRAPTSPTTINAHKTHCIHGHPLSGGNLAVESGKRKCRTCKRARDLARWHAKKDRTA